MKKNEKRPPKRSALEVITDATERFHRRKRQRVAPPVAQPLPAAPAAPSLVSPESVVVEIAPLSADELSATSKGRVLPRRAASTKPKCYVLDSSDSERDDADARQSATPQRRRRAPPAPERKLKREDSTPVATLELVDDDDDEWIDEGAALQSTASSSSSKALSGSRRSFGSTASDLNTSLTSIEHDSDDSECSANDDDDEEWEDASSSSAAATTTAPKSVAPKQPRITKAEPPSTPQPTNNPDDEDDDDDDDDEFTRDLSAILGECHADGEPHHEFVADLSSILSTPSQPKLKADPTTLETVKQEDHANDDDSEQELLENPRLEPIDVDNEEATPKRKVPARRLSKEEKEVALEFHKSHLLALLGHYLYLSDHVLSDATLQATILSMTPEELHRVPEVIELEPADDSTAATTTTTTTATATTTEPESVTLDDIDAMLAESDSESPFESSSDDDDRRSSRSRSKTKAKSKAKVKSKAKSKAKVKTKGKTQSKPKTPPTRQSPPSTSGSSEDAVHARWARAIMQWFLHEFTVVSAFAASSPSGSRARTSEASSKQTLASKLKAKMDAESAVTSTSSSAPPAIASGNKSKTRAARDQQPQFVLVNPPTVTVDALLTALHQRRGTAEQLTICFGALCRACQVPMRFVAPLQPFPVLPISLAGLGISSSEPKPSKSKASQIINSPYFKATPETPRAVKHEGSIAPARCGWIELFDAQRRSWFPVDLLSSTLGDAAMSHVQPRKFKFVPYLVAVTLDAALDVTAKYTAARWSLCFKQRIKDIQWWEAVLKQLCVAAESVSGTLSAPDNESLSTSRQGSSPNAKLQLEEEEEVARRLLASQPLPTSKAAFKNHPLYCIEEHVTRYQFIYPRTIVGHFHEAPVFPRSSLIELKSADKWIQSGREVLPDQLPLKTIHSVFKRGKNGEHVPVPLFAEWQTELYNVPIAENGIVPTNKFGNVYLFKPWMLPKGCTHLRLNPSSCAQVGRKLGIHSAPAMIGWTYRGYRSVPDIDGVVVCEEKAAALEEACHAHETLKAERQEQRRQKQIRDTWRKLMRGLLLRERLERRYGGDMSDAVASSSAKVRGDSSSDAAESLDDLARSVERQYHEHDFGDESTHTFNATTGLCTKRCACGFSVTFEQL